MTTAPERTDPVSEVAAACAAGTSIEESLGWALGTVMRAYARAAATALGDLPGGPRGYLVLTVAAEPLPSSQQALGRRVGVDRSVMTYLVDDLVAADLVQRQADPDDRRARHIVVTPAGRRRLEELHERLATVEAHLLRGLSADERDAFRTALLQVARNAEDAGDPAEL